MKKNRLSRVPSKIHRRIENIRLDHRSGSAELALKALDVFKVFATSANNLTLEEYRGRLELIARRLVEAQPEMVALVNVSNSLLLQTERVRSLDEIEEQIRSFCLVFEKRIKTSVLKVAAQALKLIKEGSEIITYSRSSTVEATLIAAKKKGKDFRVICPESRPLCEGITLAKRLGRIGIAVTVTTDAAAFASVGKATIVLVGADAVTSHYIVNKVGTSVLARNARARKVPLYVLCGSEKYVPTRYRVPLDRLRDPCEVLPQRLKNVVISNACFDKTPLNQLTGIVSENGLEEPRLLIRNLRKAILHKALLL